VHDTSLEATVKLWFSGNVSFPQTVTICGSKSKYCDTLNSKFVYTDKKVLIKMYLRIIEHKHSRSSMQYLPMTFISLERNLSNFLFEIPSR